MQDHEQFYDEEIAPVLLELCKKCEEKGLPFVALCQYADDATSRTEFVPAASDPAIRLAHIAANTNGNFDYFAECAKQDGLKYGHNSTALRILLEYPAFVPLRQT